MVNLIFRLQNISMKLYRHLVNTLWFLVNMVLFCKLNYLYFGGCLYDICPITWKELQSWVWIGLIEINS